MSERLVKIRQQSKSGPKSAVSTPQTNRTKVTGARGGSGRKTGSASKRKRQAVKQEVDSDGEISLPDTPSKKPANGVGTGADIGIAEASFFLESPKRVRKPTVQRDMVPNEDEEGEGGDRYENAEDSDASEFLPDVSFESGAHIKADV